MHFYQVAQLIVTEFRTTVYAGLVPAILENWAYTIRLEGWDSCYCIQG